MLKLLGCSYSIGLFLASFGHWVYFLTFFLLIYSSSLCITNILYNAFLIPFGSLFFSLAPTFMIYSKVSQVRSCKQSSLCLWSEVELLLHIFLTEFTPQDPLPKINLSPLMCLVFYQISSPLAGMPSLSEPFLALWLL